MKLSNLVIMFYITLLMVSCSKNDDATKTEQKIETPNARQQAINDYQNMFVAAKVNNFTWNGNTSNCTSGTLSKEVLDKALLRLHYFRKAAGLSNNGIVFLNDLNNKSQQNALMIKANNKLDHFPTSDWKCYTAEGAEAARYGNIAFGLSDVDNIDLWIEDEGSNNKEVGHRRWMLFSKATNFGFGCTNSSGTLWVINSGASKIPLPASTPKFIAWPPANFIPSAVVYPRWSFSIPVSSYPFQVDFSKATVSMTDAAGIAIPLLIEYANTIQSIYVGDNAIVWRPSGIKLNCKEDQKYKVNISNVMVEGNPKNYWYEVTIINP